MKGVFKIVIVAVSLIVALLVIAGLVLPRKWHVERALLMNASPEVVHSFVSDLRRWPDWADGPAAAHFDYRYSGPASGVGVTRSWQGPKVGSGRLTIVRSEPTRGTWFESAVGSDDISSRGSITYEEGAAGTHVVWRDAGELPMLYGPFLRDGLETQLRPYFDAGLRRLKRLAETEQARREPHDGAP